MCKKLPLLLILTGLLTLLAGGFILFNEHTPAQVQSHITHEALTGQLAVLSPASELLFSVLMIGGLWLTATGFYALRKQKRASAKNSITFDFTQSKHRKTLHEVVGVCLVIGSAFLSL
jgi:hypothetical protein